MALQINTNVAALNAQRNLSNTNRSLGILFEQLSSGLRVNRAADDAAGLAISERMRRCWCCLGGRRHLPRVIGRRYAMIRAQLSCPTAVDLCSSKAPARSVVASCGVRAAARPLASASTAARRSATSTGS